MNLDEIAKNYEDYVTQVDGLTTMILKAHLVTEEVLNRIAEEHVCDTRALSKAKLSFYQLLNVVRALVKHDLSPSFWASIEKLNKLRNLVAHNIEPRDLEKHLGEFKGLSRQSFIELSEGEKPDDGSLEHWLGYIVGCLEAIYAHSSPNK